MGGNLETPFGSQTFLGGLLWRGPPDVLGASFGGGLQTTIRALFGWSSIGAPTGGLHLLPALSLTFCLGAPWIKRLLTFFGSSLWGLPSLGAFWFTFSRNTLNKSSVGLFWGLSSGSGLQGPPFQKGLKDIGVPKCPLGSQTFLLESQVGPQKHTKLHPRGPITPPPCMSAL